MRGLAGRIHWQHSADEFWAVYRGSTCAVERRRAQTLALLRDGHSRSEVQAITRYSDPGYADVLHDYMAHGLDGLKDRRHRNPGAPTLLSAAQMQQLAQAVRQDDDRGVMWHGAKVQRWVREHLGQEVHLARTYEFLAAIGFSRQSPRPRHAQADEAAQQEFKKTR